jgi:CRISPR-associated protein Cas1
MYRKNLYPNSRNRLFVKITRESLPQVKNRYPFLYLEHGRLEVDDSSVKWIDKEGQVVRLPIATLNALFLGPGTSLTHESIKTIARAMCSLCWVGESSLIFYAGSLNPTADTSNLKNQIDLATKEEKSIEVVRNLFAFRFPDEDVDQYTKQELMGLEGLRIKSLYRQKAIEYGVPWKGRCSEVKNIGSKDITNQALTMGNSWLYGILCSVVTSLGYSPHIGFIHSGSPLPFVYDLADLYKSYLTIDLAFSMASQLSNEYDIDAHREVFLQKVIEMDLLAKIPNDIKTVFKVL